ncbi:MAG TPA: PhnD/SsuA/transferrin family substrate-binding protein [Steroidobacteraceae bacterium]|nr:PhnD/SsuA/transferrin family substrate-binding protein [Steroidobacteraceae bacterium]
MSGWIANARMYSVTPEVESLWRALLGHIARDADMALSYVPYPAPQPLEQLWSRPDLGAVLMCGYPIAMQLASVVPLAAPIPSAPWAAGRAVYRTDLIVREGAPFSRLEDTFGGRAGWTVAHSQSGFNAFRHELLRYRSAARPTLYAEVIGNLVTARNVLDAVRERRIDVGPLDAYWHLLIAQHAPQLVEGVRVLASTPLTPMPPFVAAAGMAPELIQRLRAAFAGAARRAWFAPFRMQLLLSGFAAVDAQCFAPLLEWDRAARAAGYELPA